MGNKHTSELLIEANKQISQLIDQIEGGSSDQKAWVNDLNKIIRQLDHVVEDLEK